MTRWWLFAPFGAMVVMSGWLGWKLGQPQSDTAIISAYAADYMKQSGASPEHCEARPTTQKHVRMIIECIQPSGRGLRYIVGHRGELIEMNVIADAQGLGA